jgi:hypothetical protein
MRMNSQNVQGVSFSKWDRRRTPLCDHVQVVFARSEPELKGITQALQFEVLYLHRLKKLVFFLGGMCLRSVHIGRACALCRRSWRSRDALGGCGIESNWERAELVSLQSGEWRGAECVRGYSSA